MKRYCILLGILLIIHSSCSNEESKSTVSYQKLSFDYLQSYVDSGSYYYLKAIEEIEKGEQDIRLVEGRYSGKIAYYHQKLSNTFDSVTNEYMSKRITQHQYDEIRNAIILDSVIVRSERLSELGLNIDLD